MTDAGWPAEARPRGLVLEHDVARRIRQVVISETGGIGPLTNHSPSWGPIKQGDQLQKG